MTLYKHDGAPGGGDVGVAYCEVKNIRGAHEDLPSIRALRRKEITWTNEDTARKYGPTMNIPKEDVQRALDGSNI